MDPLSALSLAGSVIQFVDFGITLLSGAGRLYRSPTGGLPVNDEIELITSDLKALIIKLQGPTKSPAATSQLSENDEDHVSFHKICNGALEIADDVLQRLNRLKVSDGKGRKLESIRKAILACWKEKEIKIIVNRLKYFKKALETRVLFELSDKFDNQAIYLSSRFAALDTQTKQIARAILESRDESTNELSQELSSQLRVLTVVITQLMSRQESLNQNEHRQTRELLNERYFIHKHRSPSLDHNTNSSERPNLRYDEIVSDFEMLDVSDATESALRVFLGKKVLQSLKYPNMTSRYENVIEAYPNTYEWAFVNSPGEQSQSSTLPQWLKNGDGIYWVSGKAGSGKSTLMKHIVDDPRTTSLLKAWAGQSKLCIATFFFWNSGTKDQRSHAGLLRSLLFQVLSQQLDLIPIVAPQKWAANYSRTVCKAWTVDDDEETWTLRELEVCFQTLVSQQMVQLNICFLIDGLDEFDGDHDQVSSLFKKISAVPGIKACLSSRPWVVFEDLFVNCPMLRLQDLTYHDIKSYVSDKMRRNNAFQRLEEEEPEEAPALIKEIVDKAKGVFIWVTLVVQSLLNGLRNQDEISDLWTRLRLLPEDIKPLYRRLLDLIEPVYSNWASKAFQIVRNVQDLSSDPFSHAFTPREGVKPLSTMAFLMAMNQDVDLRELVDATGQKCTSRCSRIKVQLTARCAGLLEISSTQCDTITGRAHSVQYFHRTARDFLHASSSTSSTLPNATHTDFQPNTCLMRICLGVLRIEFLRAKQKLHDGSGIIGRVVEDFMVYAYHAEVKNEDSLLQVELLDQMSVIMAKIRKAMYGSSSRWIADTWSRITELDFLNLTTIYGLRGYVETKLRQYDVKQIGSITTELLRYLLPTNERNATLRIPYPRVEMVSLLLKYQASPSGSNHSPSALENAFNHVLLMPPGQANLWGEDSKPRALDLRYFEILRMFIAEHDTQRDCVAVPKAIDEKSVHLIQSFLEKDHAADAAAVAENIRFLRPPTSHKRRLESASDDLDDFDDFKNYDSKTDDDSSIDLERPRKLAKMMS